MRVIDTELGVPLNIVSTPSDAAALWDWLTPYRQRGDWLAWDGETCGLTDEITPWHPAFWLRTAQMSDGRTGWVIQSEKPGMLDVTRTITAAHPRWVAHFAENDIRFADRGAPGSVHTDWVDPHFACSQVALAWYDPRTVTGTDIYSANERLVWLPNGLKPSASRVLGTEVGSVLSKAASTMYDKFKDLAPKDHKNIKAAKTWGFTNISVDDPDYLRYGGLDAVIECRMWYKMMAELQSRGQWPQVIPYLRRQWHIDLMTLRGFPTDLEYAKWLDAQLRQVVLDHIVLLAEHRVNISGMGDSVGEAFNRLGVRSTRKTSSGADSWDGQMLNLIIENEHLATTPDHHRAAELARALNLVRKSTKFLSAYVKPMILAHHGDGRVHCSMREIGSVTSRKSAARPALLQLPKRTDKRVRAGYVAPDGWVIVTCDMRQGEPRTMAGGSGDPVLQRDIEAGDFNNAIAARTYGAKFNPEEIEDPGKPGYHYRQQAKFGFLAHCYTCGIEKLAGLLKVDNAESKRIRDKWRSDYSVLTAFEKKLNQQQAIVLESGWVAPLWDRYLLTKDGLRCGHKPSRLGLNVYTQGNQAVLLNIAIDRLIDWGWSWALVLFVHDEVVGLVPEGLAEQFKAACNAAMTMDFHGFPIRCKAGIEGRSWMPQEGFDRNEAVELINTTGA
jgi:DNA polymerase I-like protein with 3'-5' exonuclease and polymerase domains